MTEMERQRRIQELLAELRELQKTPRSDWHIGFEALLLIDLYQYGNRVQLRREEILGVEPPRADYLILVQDGSVRFEKEIFRSFRKFNVLEYKNPQDRLNGDVLRKICAYGNFLISTANPAGSIPDDQVTLSVFRARKNQKLFSDLEKRGMLVHTEVPGIYRVEKLTDLPLQIVITNELSGPEYAAYRALSDQAKQADVRQVMENDQQATDEELHNWYRTVMKLIVVKNPDIFEEMGGTKQMTADGLLRKYLKEDMEQYDKEIKELKEQNKQQEKQYKQQISQLEKQNQQLALQTTAAMLKNMMQNAKCTLKQAMDTLGIPAKDRKKLKALLES